MFYNTPRLPRALLHTLTVIKRTYVRGPGGQSKPVEETVTSFLGVVMPLSNLDWKQLPEGSYTQNSRNFIRMTPWTLSLGKSSSTHTTVSSTPSSKNCPTTPSTRCTAILWKG